MLFLTSNAWLARFEWRRLFILSISEGQPVGFGPCEGEPPQVALKVRGSSSIAVDRGMAHVASRDHVNDILGDVRGMVGNALQVFGYQNQFKRRKDHGRVTHHIGEQFPEN